MEKYNSHMFADEEFLFFSKACLFDSSFTFLQKIL